MFGFGYLWRGVPTRVIVPGGGDGSNEAVIRSGTTR